MSEAMSLVPARVALPEKGTQAEEGAGEWEAHPRWERLAAMPLCLSASVAIPGFRVRDLVALHAGTVLATRMGEADNVPVEVGASPLGWGEFEVVEQTLAVRLVRLA